MMLHVYISHTEKHTRCGFCVFKNYVALYKRKEVLLLNT